MASVLRWLLLTGPARAYKRGEATGGRTPWLYLMAVSCCGAAGGIVGAVVGWVTGDVTSGFVDGLAVAVAVVVVWLVYGLALVAVMKFRNQPLESLVGHEWLSRRRKWYDR